MVKGQSKGWENLAILVVSVLIISVAVYFSSRNGGGIAEPLKYVNTETAISFNYPANFITADEAVGDDVQVVNLYPKALGKATGEVISITDMTIDSEQSVIESAANYLEVDQNKITKSKRNNLVVARYVSYSPAGEVSYYNFFKDGSRFAVIRFNQKVYDQTNPLILRDNSFYNFAYTTVLNSLKFSTGS